MLILNHNASENSSSSRCSNLAVLLGTIHTVDHFRKLAASLGRRANGRQRTLLRMLQSMSALIWELDPDFRLHGRIKSLESISSKMLHNSLDASQVLDIVGIRVITRHPSDCYRLIRRVHSEFQVLTSEYDDYIAAPKLNGYRSIHTTVVSPCGFPVEIQARTHAMHEICERGSAAHSVYKENRVAWIALFPNAPRLAAFGKNLPSPGSRETSRAASLVAHDGFPSLTPRFLLSGPLASHARSHFSRTLLGGVA